MDGQPSQPTILNVVRSWMDSVSDPVCDVIPCMRPNRPHLRSRSWVQSPSSSSSSSSLPVWRSGPLGFGPSVPASPRCIEARKKELEEDLKRDLAKLAEERKEGLHRIDWQLAEAVEALHAETVQRAKDRINRHNQVLAELERHAVGRGASPPSSPTEAQVGSGFSSQSVVVEEEEVMSTWSSGRASEDAETGIWDRVVGFFRPADGGGAAPGAPLCTSFGSSHSLPATGAPLQARGGAAAAAERVLRSAGAGAVGPLRPDGHGFGKGVFASGGAKEAARSRRQAPAEYRGVRCRRKTARHACGKERLDVADVIHAGRLARQSHGRTRWIADGVRVGEAKATAAAASAAPLPTGAANTFAAELQLAGLAGSPAERQPMALSDVARPHVHVLGRG
eukprot:CAMPEP_0175243952 /NCGR_PEP_ID=MMETSP0093-20121207/31840_1 /TAXON_ID=311494 /ORGANISM="Alexandrium monilatum, Strain CCMP3105" /LENGTH=393 /DNA_ID=CAMNT_0016538057 /DNA_START=145 /DNA_END=1325 /DNA_ORIENTATION=-